MISKIRATEIASNWHSGNWSALYQFSSSEIYMPENHLRYLKEIEESLHPEYNLHPSFLSQKNRKQLNSLRKWFIYKGKETGIETTYSVHPVYGYNIPFVSGTGIDKVLNISYLI